MEALKHGHTATAIQILASPDAQFREGHIQTLWQHVLTEVQTEENVLALLPDRTAEDLRAIFHAVLSGGHQLAFQAAEETADQEALVARLLLLPLNCSANSVLRFNIAGSAAIILTSNQ